MLDALGRLADAHCARHGEPGRWIVAVSGGMDSIVLAHAARAVLPAPSLVFAHLHHGLRGLEADLDQWHVERFARALGVVSIVGRAVIDARNAGAGVEAAARSARRGFFRSFAAPVWLAHHAGDQIETLLLRWQRRAAWRGLGGMRPSAPLEGARPSAPLLRPWLDIPRDRLRSYARRHGLAWREDATNADTRFARNAIRHGLLPRLEQVAPDLPGRLIAFARAADRLDRLFVRFSLGWLDRLAEVRTTPGGSNSPRGKEGKEGTEGGKCGEIRLPLERLRRLAGLRAATGDPRGDPAVYLLRTAWERVMDRPAPDASAPTLRRLLDLIGTGAPGARAPLAGGGRVERSAFALVFRAPDPAEGRP